MVRSNFAARPGALIVTTLIRVTGALILLLAPWHSSVATAQETPRASVEAVTAMLQTIDPYRPSSEATGTIKVFGSTSMDALAHGWVSGFTQFHSKAQVEVSAANSEEAFERLVADPSGIAMLSRPVKASELEELKRKGLKDPVAFVVAREALGVFVHASNPVQTISGEQLRTVFTSDVNNKELNWSVLGATGNWAKQPVHIIARTPNSGTQSFLQEFVFNSMELREGVSEHVSNAEVVNEIGKDPTSIAICGLKCGANTAKALQLTVGASVVPSDDHAVLSGQYPLTRPMTLVIDAGQSTAQSKSSKEFVHYALCQAGQRQTILAGFYPVDLPLLRAGLQKLGTQQFR